MAAISTAGGVINVQVIGSSVSYNGANGILANGSGALVGIGGNTVTGNATGLQTSGSGQIVSFGTNSVQGNSTNGAPTSTPGTI